MANLHTAWMASSEALSGYIFRFFSKKTTLNSYSLLFLNALNGIYIMFSKKSSEKKVTLEDNKMEKEKKGTVVKEEQDPVDEKFFTKYMLWTLVIALCLGLLASRYAPHMVDKTGTTFTASPSRKAEFKENVQATHPEVTLLD